MNRSQQDHPRSTDFELGLKTATIVVVLGLIVAFADQALVTPPPPSEPAIAVRTALVNAPASGAIAQHIEVPFTVNASDAEPQPPTF